jgi:negative regulator of sigma E activity
MTTEIDKDELLSAFVDGELKQEYSERIINSLHQNPEAKSCFERYQLISDAMRNQLPPAMKRDFVNCVMNAIESEPLVFAPAAITSSKKSGFTRHLTNKAAGFAIAASVATLAVIGVQSQYQQDAPKQVATMPDNSEFVRLAKEPSSSANTTMPPLMMQQPQSGFSTASSSLGQRQITRARPNRKINPQLHQYIVIHSQQASGAGMHDIISSARLVSSPEHQNLDQVQR